MLLRLLKSTLKIMRKRILVLSDNHGDLNIMQQIINTTSHDLAIHAGDYGLDPTIMEQMFDYYVDGNNDFGDKQIVTFTYEKIKFLLLHGDQVYSFNKAK
jgi:predicted phosphodiesterase